VRLSYVFEGDVLYPFLLAGYKTVAGRTLYNRYVKKISLLYDEVQPLMLNITHVINHDIYRSDFML